MAAEYGVLPSVAVWGSEALEQRTEWHLAFDFAAYRSLEQSRRKARDRSNPRASWEANRNAILSGAKGAVGTGLNLPPSPKEG